MCSIIYKAYDTTIHVCMYEFMAACKRKMREERERERERSRDRGWKISS